MATKYLLGQKAARFLHDAMNESPVGRRLQAGKVSAALEFAAPWTLRYSKSVHISGSGSSEVRGGWIIWLPDDSLEGVGIDTDPDSEGYMRPLTPAVDNMPEGWYLLPESLCEDLSEEGDHSVYADEGSEGIVFDLDGNGRIHVADVSVDDDSGSKSVMQIVRSSVLLNRRPWRFVKGGGWKDCQLQVGFNCNVRGSFDDENPRQITSCGQTADGKYFAKVNLNNDTAVVEKLDDVRYYKMDYINGFVWVYVGTVEDGVQTDGIYSVPVIYKFT